MPGKTATKKASQKPLEVNPGSIDSAAYHFIRFEAAVNENDYRGAMDAQQNLRRLGYDVQRIDQ